MQIIHAGQTGPEKTVMPGDTVEQRSQPSGTSISDDIYQALYRSIFVDTSIQHIRNSGDEFVKAHEPYERYSGRTIRNIYFTKVAIFGASVYDTLSIPHTALTRAAETMHVNTRDFILENNLLFSKGDTVNAYRIADNARVLRKLNYIYDANILIIPTDESDQLVDILIITQDVFSLGISGSVYAKDNLKINLYDRNLMGMGWEINNIIYYNSQRSPVWGYDGIFSVSNINHSFISGLVNYTTTFDRQGLRLGLLKQFLTPETKYGGGIDLSETKIYSVLDNSRSLNYSVFIQDYWLGRSLLLPDIDKRTNLTLSTRLIQKKYDVRPEIKPDSNYVFHNDALFLTALFLSEVKYFRSKMILGFGHTEDVPYGYTFSLTGGISRSEFKDRWYGGVRMQVATFADQLGYITGSMNAGSFYDGRRFENGIIRLDMLYFTHLVGLGGGYQIRQFVNGNYTIGITRLDDDQLNMDNGSYLREYVSDQYSGTQRLRIGFETVAFSPWNWFGFRYAISGFADFGWIGSNHVIPDLNKISSVFGFKFSLRNESLVLNTFQIAFAYYPHSPAGTDHFNWKFSTSEPRIFNNLGSKKPQIIPYE